MKIGRNQPCPCGSGKKYKKCCLEQQGPGKALDHMVLGERRLRKTEAELVGLLLDYAEARFGDAFFEESMDEYLLWDEYEPNDEMREVLDAGFLSWAAFDWTMDEFLEQRGEAEGEEDRDPWEQTVAAVFLREHPEKLDSFQKRFLMAVGEAPYSFHQVQGVVPGVSLTLKDLLLGKTRIVADEKAADKTIEGAILFTKVVCLDKTCIMVGTFPVPIPPVYHPNFIDFRQRLVQGRTLTPDQLKDYDLELRSALWQTFEHLENREAPQMQNTDGEPLAPVELVYDLKCTPAQAFRGLKSLTRGEEEADLLKGACYDAQGELEKIEFPWLKIGNQKHAGMTNTVMGNIAINKGRLRVEVNSDNRARKIDGEIRKRLKDKAVYKTSVKQSAEKMMEAQGAGMLQNGGGTEPISREDLEQMPEVRQQLSEMAKKQWEQWADTPVPMLDHMTPREAAKDSVGREKLEGLFLYYQTMDARHPDNPFKADIAELRRMVGLD